jgi:hypothetical protein
LEEEFSWVDETPVAGETWYYLRVSQADGEIAWSSPVFVTYEGPPVVGSPLEPWNSEEILQLQPGTQTEAAGYQQALETYLEREEDPARFSDWQAVGMVNSPEGAYAYFVGYDHAFERKVSVKWYVDFADERLRFNHGWRDFGAYRK